MKETSKASRRRWVEGFEGVFPWRDVFKGKGVDVGAGDDPLPFDGCSAFDQAHGNANNLSAYFEPETFDYVHSSQCLEHMGNPIAALQDWFSLVRPTGHLICTIPDFDLYEKRQFPSRFNGDHKAVFSLWRHGFPGVAPFYHVPTMLAEIPGAVRLCRLVTTNYDWQAPEDIDQTFIELKQVECWIEFCLRKIC